uniref:uncharacterized protein LOC120345574 n=1 Tax=Styela clava TaxID=7725 RepID=UPI0019397110|nr:uncharacterized protein LOC120345574 [Styela clava]
MKILIINILICVIDSSWCQDGTVFHCSPKPGCQIAQCDPVAVGWNRPSFNIDVHLHNKEFPITCKSKNAAQSGNTADWLPLVSRNILDIGTIKSELKQLEDNVDENRKNLDQFEKSMLDQKTNNEIQTQSNEIRNLRDKALLQSEQINDLVRRFAKQSIELNELKMENVEQFTEISDLKKDLAGVQGMNEKLIDDNRQMKKAISRLEQKLDVTDKPQILPKIFEQITRPTPTTMKPSPDPENCKLKIGNICYFAVIHDKRDVNYDNAVDICKKRNADVGLTWDKESYNAIMKYLSSNVPTGKTWINIWTGIKFDPMIGDVTPADPFIEWYPNNPNTGIKYKDRTNVYLYVKVDPKYNQGMVNGPPTWERNGVICEILI